MKRVVRKRPQSRVKSYTFHSYGTHFSFDPFRIVTDDRIVNEANMFESVTMLDLYKTEVRMANSPHVYILDYMGNEISP